MDGLKGVAFFVVLSTVSCWVDGSQKVLESTFEKMVVCNVPERVQKGCAKKITGIRSFFECQLECNINDDCIGTSVDAKGSCFLHTHCLPDITCDPEHERQGFWVSFCVTGHWDSRTSSCKCEYESFGTRCDGYYRSCDDLLYDYPPGNYRIVIDPQEDGKYPFKVNCFITPPHVHKYYVFINKGEARFDKPWFDYVNGFHIGNGFDYVWAGLTPLHRLTEAGFTHAAVRVVVSLNNTLRHLLCSYSQFQVGDEKTDYKFRSAIGDCEHFDDCFSNLQLMPFSTRDRDNTGIPNTNVASEKGSGWWFSNVSNPCHLLGRGLDNWEATPRKQRLTIAGLHPVYLPMIKWVEMVLREP